MAGKTGRRRPASGIAQESQRAEGAPLTFRATEDEKRRIDEARGDLPRSTYIRNLLLGQRPRQNSVRAAIVELHRVGKLLERMMATPSFQLGLYSEQLTEENLLAVRAAISALAEPMPFDDGGEDR